MDLAKLAPGPIVITSRPGLAAISFDPPSRRLESAGDGAADAARSVLNTPSLGHPQLEAAVGVLEFAAAPFAAAYGAVRASQQRLSPDQLAEVERELTATMRTNAASENLRETVGKTARQKTHRLLVCAESVSAVAASQARVSAVLEVAVEQFRLQAAKAHSGEYCLFIEARARLSRASDSTILLDRPYQYLSGSAMFVDWTRHGGLEGVAQTAYQSLAEQIAGDIFQLPVAPPILIGPGQKHGRATLDLTDPGAYARRRLGRNARGQLVVSLGNPALNPAFELWGAATTWKRGLRKSEAAAWGSSRPAMRPCRRQNETESKPRPVEQESPKKEPVSQVITQQLDYHRASLEIHTGAPKRLLIIHELGAASADTSTEAGAERSGTEWAMDELPHDRNAVVQAVSCVAAVPLGIWEQTVGAVRGRSRERAEKLAETLNEVAGRRHLEQEVADEVARRLQGTAEATVKRTEGPSAVTLPSSEAQNGTGTMTAGALTGCNTALEIQVVNAELAGKRRNSRSQALLVELQATITRTSDGQELYTVPIHYRSTARTLKDWAASDAILLGQEFDACSRQAAAALAEEVVAREFVTLQLRPGPADPNPR